ncbi:MAG: hypothetical protein WD577_09945 [Bacteroidales bacterium]
MKIDNQKNIYRIWLRKMAFTIVFTASIITVMFLKVFDHPESPITKYHVIIAISAVFIIISTIGVLRNPYYFYFDDSKDMLVFRYYPVGIFNSKKNSVQIPKQQFVKYEIVKYFFGMEEKLILYQNYRNKVAKYPPITLSAVDKADREKLKRALQNYSGK